MSNENEICNDGANQLWVKNENNGTDDLGGTISAARTRRRDLTDVSGVGWDLGSGFAGIEGSSLSLALSLSLFARLTRKLFEVKILTSNHFWGQSLILHGQLQITFGKFIFYAQPNTRIYEKIFSEMIWSQNKHRLSDRQKLSCRFLSNQYTGFFFFFLNGN